MLVGSVFGFLLVVAIGATFSGDTSSLYPNPVGATGPEIELAPAVVVAAGANSIDLGAVARVAATSPSGTQNGTVFQLDDGRIAGVTHALGGAEQITITTGGASGVVDPSALKTSELHDLTTIAQTRLASALSVSDIAGSVGEVVALAGIPESQRIETVTGEIISREDGVGYGISRPDVYVIDAPVAPGWSGGPVVNGFGEVIGVIIGTEQVSGVTIAVPIEHLPDL